MRKFNVEIELTEKEIELLRVVDWDSNNAEIPYSFTSESNALFDKGVIILCSDDMGGDGTWLTEVGKQITKAI
jgi:hypothetical protein